MASPISVPKFPNCTPQKVTPPNSIRGGVYYNPNSVANIWFSDTPNLLTQMDQNGNPQGAVPLAPGQTMALLPGFAGDWYVVADAANAYLNFLEGAKC